MSRRKWYDECCCHDVCGISRLRFLVIYCIVNWVNSPLVTESVLVSEKPVLLGFVCFNYCNHYFSSTRWLAVTRIDESLTEQIKTQSDEKLVKDNVWRPSGDIALSSHHTSTHKPSPHISQDLHQDLDSVPTRSLSSLVNPPEDKGLNFPECLFQTQSKTKRIKRTVSRVFITSSDCFQFHVEKVSGLVCEALSITEV